MLNLWLIGEADGSHAGDQGGLAPPQQPHPDIKQPSPPGSDKPPTSARSGGQRSMSDRRQSATRRSGMEGYDTFWAWSKFKFSVSREYIYLYISLFVLKFRLLDLKLYICCTVLYIYYFPFLFVFIWVWIIYREIK